MISKQAQRVLVRAAEILNNPKAWMRCWRNKETYSSSDRFCALGAIHRACVDDRMTQSLELGHILGMTNPTKPLRMSRLMWRV